MMSDNSQAPSPSPVNLDFSDYVDNLSMYRTIARLCEAERRSATSTTAQTGVTGVRGQVVRRNTRTTRSIFFFDIDLGVTSNGHTSILPRPASEPMLVHVCMRCTEAEQHNTFSKVSKLIKCGDVVVVGGVVEVLSHGVGIRCQPEEVEIVSRWKADRPGIRFESGMSYKPPSATRVHHTEEPGAPSEADSNGATGTEEAGVMPPPENEGPEEMVARLGLCKLWLNSGTCEKVGCSYSHMIPAETATTRQALCHALVVRRREQKKERYTDMKGHCSRALVFVEWLEETFGVDVLRRGVLDIAGGRGEVSWELIRKGYPSTVVDPRPVKLNARQHKALKRAAKEKRRANKNGVGVSAREDGDVGESSLVKSIPQCMKYFDESFGEIDEGEKALLETCGLVVGMHPDEATEPLVVTALARQKPFAVVPCCVFSSENPHRRLQDGSPVHSYEEYLTYLTEITDRQGQSAVRVVLPFEGKNIALYSLP